MSAVRKPALITEEEYLTNPRFTESEWRFEYVDGQVYAMADPSDRHEKLAGNLFAALHRHLRGHRCTAFQGRRRVRTGFLNRAFHYYPDVMVVCEEPARDERYRENPILVVEVLSPSTEATDIREKMFAYLNTASINHYIIIAQEKIEVTVYRRVPQPDGWEVETLDQATDVLRVPDLGFEMSVADIYEKSGILP
jgi:Uma2 family endonuclease